jgi:hypothetical protein
LQVESVFAMHSAAIPWSDVTSAIARANVPGEVGAAK